MKNIMIQKYIVVFACAVLLPVMMVCAEEDPGVDVNNEPVPVVEEKEKFGEEEAPEKSKVDAEKKAEEEKIDRASVEEAVEENKKDDEGGRAGEEGLTEAESAQGDNEQPGADAPDVEVKETEVVEEKPEREAVEEEKAEEKSGPEGFEEKETKELLPEFMQEESKGTEVKFSTESPKSMDINVESVEGEEKMSFDADINESKVIEEVFGGKSDGDSRLLDYKILHEKHGAFSEKSSVKKDFIEAGLLAEPPENYIYVYEVEDPARFKGWELQIVNSSGDIMWIASNKSAPPKKFVWDGYDSRGQWKAVIGEQYSFVFKALSRKEKKNVYWEESFVVDSYILDKGKGKRVAIRFSTKAVFDEKGLNVTSRGRNILRKVFYKMKSLKYSKGMIEVKSSNRPLARVQLEYVVKFAHENLVNMNIITTTIAEDYQGIHYFEVLLTKK